MNKHAERLKNAAEELLELRLYSHERICGESATEIEQLEQQVKMLLIEQSHEAQCRADLTAQLAALKG